MHTVFWPHLDHEKVSRVLAMNWFVDPNANTSTNTNTDKTKAN
jgi:hypothetical protein